MYGVFTGERITAETPFNPTSPYAINKYAAHMYCDLYRKAHGIRIFQAISFNHESPHRNLEFVTRKVTHAVAMIQEQK